MTQPQNLFIPADAGEKVTLPGIEITIKGDGGIDRERLCRLRGSDQSWSRSSAPCAKLLRNFISFYHQAYRTAVWGSRHNILYTRAE